MPPFNTYKKNYHLSGQPSISPSRLTEPIKIRPDLHLHNFPPLRKEAQRKPRTWQEASLSEKTRQHISNLINDPSLPISLKDINRKLEQLVEEKKFRKKHLAQFSSLTPREKEVLFQLAQGFTNRKIARQLSLRLETVKHYRKIIKSKLEASSTTDFIRYAQAYNLSELLREKINGEDSFVFF